MFDRDIVYDPGNLMRCYTDSVLDARYCRFAGTWIVGATLIILTVTSRNVHSDTIQFKSKTVVDGPSVFLRDVARLSGPRAEKLGDLIVAKFEHRSSWTLELDTLREKLSAQNVNWGQISLGGHLACVVRRAVPSEPKPEPPTAGPDRTSNTTNPDLSMTLREQVIQLIESYARAPRDELKIEFDSSHDKLLNQSIGRDRFEFEPIARVPFGRVPIVIRQYGEDQDMERHLVRVDVSRRMSALVVMRQLRHGQTITPKDVQLQEVWLDAAHSEPATAVEAVIGQVARTRLTPGRVISTRDLKPPALVRRNEPMTVRCMSGQLMITTTARALEDGVRGQFIRVRNERSHRRRKPAIYTVQVTGTKEGRLLLTPAPPENADATRQPERVGT